MKRLLGNLSIKAGLTGVLGLFIALIMLVSFLGYQSSQLGSASIQELNTINVQQLNELNRAQVNVADTQLGFLNHLDAINEGDPALARRYLEMSERFLDSAQERFNAFQVVPKSEQGRPYADRLEDIFTRLVERGLEPQLAALQQGNESAYRAAKREGDAINQEFIEANRDFVTYANERGANLMEHFADTMQTYGTIGLAALLLVVICVAAVRVGMMRILIRPLQEAVQHFEQIAKGDLSQRITDRGRNEIGQLFAAMQHMQTGLQQTVATVRDSSGSIHIGAREIASGNADLSSRTEEQAASLQETAASMDQLTATVRQNAENARQASALAKEASSTAGRGGKVVEEVVHTMHGITESSRKVADIISVIDSIAFQTNILALNASVEAARAGEQGRGFAVVASEVRNLASRSAEAAGEIKRLIEASSEQVDKGSSLVESAGTTMQEILTSVRRVTDIMDEISAASQEQSSGIEQVNTAVTQMDEVTQQNAALVEQASAAAASLEAQAAQLEAAVATFRLSDNQPSGMLEDPRVAAIKSGSREVSKLVKKLAAPTSTHEGEWAEF
ncbi:methyl-accepting chemotaxis protein [Marinobacter sp. TBZ242]|uniref:Methyl-accepting chemotaxis protein n=1 Tax=Marinobacter azerbaijanicus TaxID=3050455 RepID=A0ABT7IKR7_9GAMM|nr:methyl-accepting chemotaxis protein [Marinobacter sp. TBZ242]MDL0433679.1 methyl-accepting chemotaxis protein [Marinobacter sp. TBZ242]